MVGVVFGSPIFNPDNVTNLLNDNNTVSAYQSASTFTPFEYSPAASSNVWGFTEYFNTYNNLSAPVVQYLTNAQVVWANLAQYASILDAVICSAAGSVSGIASNAQNGVTSLTATITLISTNNVLVVFVTTDTINAQTGTVTITDGNGNTWIQQAVQNIIGSPGAVWEFYAHIGSASGNDVITATLSASTDVFMQVCGIVGGNGTRLFGSPFPSINAPTSASTVGSTSTVFINVPTGNNVIILAFFGGLGFAAAKNNIIANIGNASGVGGVPVQITSPSNGQVLTYENGVWVNM